VTALCAADPDHNLIDLIGDALQYGVMSYEVWLKSRVFIVILDSEKVEGWMREVVHEPCERRNYKGAGRHIIAYRVCNR